jgi:predicted ATPase/DNA-binding SARP family transcriptional activator/Tfp pilus assembly protein PilF
MNRLSIALLGSFEVTLDDEPITNFRADSARALLVYLVMHAEMSFQRTFLATLLWPDQPESEALHALRQALNRLRNAIHDRKATPSFLNITRTTIGFNPESDYWLDVSVFEELIAATTRHSHRRLPVCRSCHRRLTRAAELYRGEMLAGFFLDSSPFEEWLLMEREYLHRQAIDVFHPLAAYHEQRGAFARAQHYARRQVELEPWREEAHQQLMRALDLSGQRSAALAQYNTCRQLLATELGMAPTATTEVLYEQIQAETLERRSQPPHNLPAQLSPFIGRKAELAQITEKINHLDCRLLTLVGPGGVGKTRLALQIAWDALGTFKDGVYFVPLTAVRSPEALPIALAQALGFHFRSGENLQAQLNAYLKRKEVLLVLDNFEHLLQGAGLIVNLLQQAADVRVLTTSQKPLDAPGEWLFNVKAFEYPQDGCMEELEQYHAVHFFAESARRWRPDFSLDAANRSYVARVCRLVAGVPLALELAASWLRVLSCQEIAQEIQEDLDFLRSSAHGVPERHRSIRAVFEYSWKTLTAGEQRTLQRLTVFRGSFNREAALRVADTSFSTLVALVDKSMLQRVTYERATPVTRYVQHNLVRHYAKEKLALDPAAALSAQERHCDYYCTLLQDMEDDLTGGAQHQARELLSSEIENIRVAWDWAVDHEKISAIRRALEGLTQFYCLCGWFQEGDTVFRQAIEKLSQISPLPDSVLHIIHRLSARRGTFLGHLGRYEEAEALLQTSLKGLQAFEDTAALVASLNSLSFISNRQGDYAKAKDLLKRALALSRAAQLRQLEADSLSQLGAVYFYLADYATSSDYYAQTLHIRRELGDRFGESLALGNLGLTVYEQSNFKAAKAYFEESWDILRHEVGNREREGWILNNLGMMALDYGEYTDALDYYQQALRISRDIGDLWGESNTLGNLGIVHWSLGDFAQAGAYYAEAIEIKREIDDGWGESMITGFQSLLFHDLGRFSEALDRGQRALAIAEDLGSPEVQAYALTFVGHAQVKLGSLEEAAGSYQQALILRRDLEQHGLAMEIVSRLAHLSLLQGKSDQAQAHAEEIVRYLENETLDGALETSLVYWTCYRVLRANRHPQAGEILDTAYQRVQAHAAKISSPELRDSFLNNVAAHVQIVRAWEKHH